MCFDLSITRRARTKTKGRAIFYVRTRTTLDLRRARSHNGCGRRAATTTHWRDASLFSIFLNCSAQVYVRTIVLAIDSLKGSTRISYTPYSYKSVLWIWSRNFTSLVSDTAELLRCGTFTSVATSSGSFVTERQHRRIRFGPSRFGSKVRSHKYVTLSSI